MSDILEKFGLDRDSRSKLDKVVRDGVREGANLFRTAGKAVREGADSVADALEKAAPAQPPETLSEFFAMHDAARESVVWSKDAAVAYMLGRRDHLLGRSSLCMGPAQANHVAYQTGFLDQMQGVASFPAGVTGFFPEAERSLALERERFEAASAQPAVEPVQT